MTAIFAHRGFTGMPGARESPGAPGAPGAVAGTADGPPENSLAAFAAAGVAGADGVELDARVTADAELAIHHDRLVPGNGPITNMRAGALPGRIPLLAEALDVCSAAGLLVNVEVKAEPGADPGRRVAVAVAAALAGRRGVLASSFDPPCLEVVRQRAPAVPVGLLIDWRTDPYEALEQAAELGCATLHPFFTQVDAFLQAAAARAGLALHVWTVNADADLLAMAALGVGAVITDRTERAVELLGGQVGGRAGDQAGGHVGDPPGRNGGGSAR